MKCPTLLASVVGGCFLMIGGAGGIVYAEPPQPAGGFQKPKTTKNSVVIQNSTENPVRYRLRRGANWRTYILQPGKGIRHTAKSKSRNFGIQFDGKIGKGVDLKTYRLNTGNAYRFRVRDGKLSIYKQ